MREKSPLTEGAAEEKMLLGGCYMFAKVKQLVRWQVQSHCACPYAQPFLEGNVKVL